MADAKSITAMCGSLIRRLGVLGILFALFLLLLLVLAFTRYSTALFLLDTVAVAVTGIWSLVRLTRLIARNPLWSLRNRLLMVYGLIGVLPILLILLLVGSSLWALTSELAIYLASSELNRRLDGIRAAIQGLERIPPENRKYAAPNVVDYFRTRFPGLRLYIADSTGEHHYPDSAPPFKLVAGWGDATGLLESDGQFFGWSHSAHNGTSFTAVVPLTNELIADLVPNLGQITLTETPHRHGEGDTMSVNTSQAEPDFDYTYKDGKLISKKAGEPAQALAIHNAGRLPPPMSRFDVDVNWIAVYPHYDLTDPNRKHPAVLMVRSRPSAVLSAIFTGTDLFRTVLWGIVIGVAILFLIVEIVALVIGVSLARRITSAINELYEGTRRVIYGDFAHRIPVRGSDQLGELNNSFNQMTGNLQRLLSVEKEKERLQAELEIAREVQTQLYPRSAPPSRGLQLTVHCEPARVVSGDYYDYESVQHHDLAFAIGDVAGKGISAALLMATIQAALRAQISSAVDGQPGELDSARLVTQLNRQIYAHTAPEKYATFFFAMYNDASGILTYTNAGHLPPILIRGSEATTLDINGTVVGAFPSVCYDESRLAMQPGDLLVCYTDGITEPENAYGEMFGEERLIEIVKQSAVQDDQTIIQNVIEAVRTWHASTELPDDMTLLIARRLETA